VIRKLLPAVGPAGYGTVCASRQRHPEQSENISLFRVSQKMRRLQVTMQRRALRVARYNDVYNGGGGGATTE
jgi:hypothetical protein